MRDPVTCKVDGCHKVTKWVFCVDHRFKGPETACAPKPRRPKLPAGKFRTGHGYVMVWTEPRFPGSRPYGSGWAILEHHKVMGEIIGRAVMAGERVKHRDGDGMNNEPSNLELWLNGKPVVDWLVLARVILDRYVGLFGTVECGL